MTRKTWKEKLEDNKKFPKILELKENFPCYAALRKMGAKPGDKVVLAPGKDIYQYMNQVPEGRLQTLSNICKKLASDYEVDYCCTLTTGIYVTIAANASKEMGEYLPFWRTIKNDGSLNPKYPGDAEYQKQRLIEEGFTIITRGRKNIKYFVENFENYLIDEGS
jgi:alkylated DNA nucleotide flippase Atl1